jgi:hypothetical protein
MFIQPDWFEVTKPGVGTNRYAYAGDDPVNGMDPGGNSWLDGAWDGVFGAGSFNSTFGDSGSAWSDATFGSGYEKTVGTAYSAFQSPDGAKIFHENYPTYGDFKNDLMSGASGVAKDETVDTALIVSSGVGAIGLGLAAKGAAALAEDATVKIALNNARNNAALAASFLERNVGLVKEAGAKGYFGQVEEHLIRLEEFVRNPGIRPGMEGMGQNAIRAQQVARVQKLESDIFRNLSQGLAKIERYLE